MNSRVILALCLVGLIFVSCKSDPGKSESSSKVQSWIDEIKGPQPWPEDAMALLKGSITQTDKYNQLVYENGQTCVDEYFSCIIEKSKNKYPDYAKFKKAQAADPQSIQNLMTSCLDVLNREREWTYYLDDDNSDFGQIKFINDTRQRITLAIAYYFEGPNWHGFVSQGWWVMQPGAIARINLPLNFMGYLNNSFYYYAKNDNGNYYGGQERHFLVVENEVFKIPMADLATTQKYSPKLTFKYGFSKYELGGSSVNRTIRFGS